VPSGIFGLQRDQLGDGVAPALRPAASVRRASVARAGLSFYKGERVLTFEVAVVRHGVISVT
jgi:hypothetical protein